MDSQRPEPRAIACWRPGGNLSQASACPARIFCWASLSDDHSTPGCGARSCAIADATASARHIARIQPSLAFIVVILRSRRRFLGLLQLTLKSARLHELHESLVLDRRLSQELQELGIRRP